MSSENTTSRTRICQSMAEDVVAHIQSVGVASKNEVIMEMCELKNPRFNDVEHLCEAVAISLERGLAWGILEESHGHFKIADESLIPKDTKAAVNSLHM
ncbi:GL25793 [Drosophila persimilis]|uniref:GL25793 n=1 Tax=Drosophila persimilis TaxID=7234 RepID=B4GJW2_DROPE|nr:GL25793 [Drosophila persimilis]